MLQPSIILVDRRRRQETYFNGFKRPRLLWLLDFDLFSGSVGYCHIYDWQWCKTQLLVGFWTWELGAVMVCITQLNAVCISLAMDLFLCFSHEQYPWYSTSDCTLQSILGQKVTAILPHGFTVFESNVSDVKHTYQNSKKLHSSIFTHKRSNKNTSSFTLIWFNRMIILTFVKYKNENDESLSICLFIYYLSRQWIRLLCM